MSPQLRKTPTNVVVRQSMNEHGTMTVEVEGKNETRHLVEYESAELRETLSKLPSGTRIPLTMARAGARSNVWRVVDFHGGRAPATVDAERYRIVD
jgi:hypothetical protein